MLLYAFVNPGDLGGVQAVFNRVAAHLRRQGHLVTKGWPLPHPGNTHDIACPLPLLVWRRGLPAPRSVLWGCQAVLRMGWRLLRERPSVVNVHFVTGEAIYFVLFKRLFRYKLVLSFHGSDILRPQPQDASRLPDILRAADGITTVSRLTARRVQEASGLEPARVHVIPNGISYEYWSEAIRDTDRRRRPPVVLSIGRLDPVKGQDVLIKAFARVRELVPDATLVIVGDGGFRAALERLGAELGLQQVIEFAGQLDPERVRERMAEAGVYVLPSRSEGLPLALLEAMAAGLPVVATRVGGVPEVLSDATGVMVPPEDPESLAEALARVLLGPADPTDRIERARRRAREYSAAAADTAYEQLLAGMAARPPAFTP